MVDRSARIIGWRSGLGFAGSSKLKHEWRSFMPQFQRQSGPAKFALVALKLRHDKISTRV